MKGRVIGSFVALVVLAASAALVGHAASGTSDPRSDITRNAKPVGAPEKVHASVDVDDGRWVMGGYENSAGEACASQVIPDEGTSRLCLDAAEMFADGREVVAFPGGRQKSSQHAKMAWDNLWVYGFASPRVASLELVNMDCSTKPLALDGDRAFMHVASRSEIVRGVVPLRIVARDSAGTAIYSRDVSLGLPNNAKKAGLKELQPGASCD